MQDIILWVAGARYVLRSDTDRAGLERELVSAARDGGRFVDIPAAGHAALRLLVTAGLPLGFETKSRQPVVGSVIDFPSWLDDFEINLI